MDRKQRFTYHFFLAAELLVAAYLVLYIVLMQGPLSHSTYDSYTRQAAAWWSGSAHLPGNVPWLELAVYNGNYYVSFPPFPSVVQFLLYPVFGINTPDNLLNTLFALGAFTLIYRFLMRRGYSGFAAAVFALLMTLGSNLFYISVTGWVWFSAQTEAFFFSALAVYLIYSNKKVSWYFSFLSLGIAFACRPFQLVYAPLLLYMLYKNLGGKGFWRKIACCVKYVLPLAFVGVCAAAYNYIRFGNIFEFGHDYLPEFEYAKQFSLSYIPQNFLEILKIPVINAEAGDFWPKFNGTLFFLVNPVFIMLAVSMVRQKFTMKHLVYALCFAAQFTLLLTHKTMGGWQFGSRYLADMIPFMLVVFAGDEKYKKQAAGKELILPASLTAAGAAINIWGAVWLYVQWLQQQGRL